MTWDAFAALCGKVPAGSSHLAARRCLRWCPGELRVRPHIAVQSAGPRPNLHFSFSEFCWRSSLRMFCSGLIFHKPAHCFLFHLWLCRSLSGAAILCVQPFAPARCSEVSDFPACLLIHMTGTLPRQHVKLYKIIRILCTLFLQCRAQRGRVCTSPCRSCNGEERAAEEKVLILTVL